MTFNMNLSFKSKVISGSRMALMGLLVPNKVPDVKGFPKRMVPAMAINGFQENSVN